MNIVTKTIVRMSESGKCPRALSAEWLGYKGTETPKWLEQTAAEGNWHEERIIQELRSNQDIIVDGRQQEVILSYPNFNLVGHIDGIIRPLPVSDTSKAELLEIKSMSQFEFDRWMRGNRFESFYHYAAQITCYMLATGLWQCRYIVKNRNSGYQDKQTIDKPPLDMKQIVDRLELAIFSTEQEVLAPAEFDPMSVECKRCAYSKLCIPEPERITGISKVVLDNAVRDWRLGKELAIEAEKLIASAEDTFKSFNTELPKWRYNGLAISKSHVKYNQYDKKLLEATFEPRQLLPVVKVVEFDRMLVTDLEKKKGQDE